MFGAAFCDELTKLALKYTSKDYKGNSFTYATDKELRQAVQRQGPIRGIVGLAPKEQRPWQIRQLNNRLKYLDGRFGGTITPNKHQGRNIMLLNRNLRDRPKTIRRMVLAHEAFHGKTPVLGHSEILAHAYGGWKANKGLKKLWNTDTKSGGFGTGALNQVGLLAKVRPSRMLGELAIAGGLGYGAYRGGKAIYNALKSKKDDEKAE
jgi:hypothetical protein